MKLTEHHKKLMEENPENKPMSLELIGEILFPDFVGPHSHNSNHNGGCTKREYCVAGLMGRMLKKGLVKRPKNWHPTKDVSLWCWVYDK